MKLYMKVIAFDEEAGLKATREHVVEVPKGVYSMNESILGGKPEALGGIATSALTAAMMAAANGGESPAVKIVEKINPSKTSGTELDKMFGFDLVEHLDRKDRK